jgi:hypothetical protein
VDYPVHESRSRSTCLGRPEPDRLDLAPTASLGAANGQRFYPDAYSEGSESAVPGAFRKLIDGWAKWLIVQPVH